MSRLRRTIAGIAVTATAGALGVAVALAGPAAGAVPTAKAGGNPALGNGLGRLVPGAANRAAAPGGVRADQERLAIRDSRGRVLVGLTPAAGVDRTAFTQRATAAGLTLTSTDVKTGALEGYVATSAITRLSALAGAGSLKLVPRPQLSAGSVTSQGVAFQGVDKVLKRGVDGRGITVGVLSDSYDTADTSGTGGPPRTRAADDVKSGDLPGKGNAANPNPVVVLQDYAAPGTTDEGRAMLQLVHDVAPKAKLCFATAFAGELQFANNIRALANPKGRCKADVIVDDVFYYDEPFFSDGPVAQAVDAVSALGVPYFSSAGNQGDPGGWTSPVRLLKASTAVKGTNLDLSDVPPALYSGGLQDMNPGAGTDVAQSVTLGDSGILDLQWDDPLDPDGARYGDPYYSDKGTLTDSTPSVSFPFTPTAAQLGKQVQVLTDGVPSGSVDLVLTVVKPDGSQVGPIDTITSPEQAGLTLDQAGTYKIVVAGFDGSTGPFTVSVRPLLAASRTTTDFNVLLFSADGQFLTASASDNRLTGLPSELLSLTGPGKLQLVIAKSGTEPTPVKRLRYLGFDNFYQDEYRDPLAPATFGHNSAKGALGVAAYDPFRSYLPEFYTSPGGRLPYYFDARGNRLQTPEYRQKPDVAATDGGNTTFFYSDSAFDPDTLPNFFGTSAAAPHAAGIAALVLQQAGGPGAVSPSQLRTRLQRSAFAHDLDPNVASGTSNGLTVTARGPQGSEGDTVPGSMTDTKFFTVSYTGDKPLRTLTLQGETASPTALGKGSTSDGVVFDPRPFTGKSPFTTQGFPFRVGTTSGVAAKDISASYGVPYGGTGTFRHLVLNFEGKGLTKGAQFTFGVDRDLAVPAAGLAPREGNGADELGGATFIPSGKVVAGGLTFRASRGDGSVVTGALLNKLGTGFSPVDGYGVIDAQRAVFGD